MDEMELVYYDILADLKTKYPEVDNDVLVDIATDIAAGTITHDDGIQELNSQFV